MSFDWSEYLTLAQELVAALPETATPQAKEAKLRCATSRAYYAVWCRLPAETRTQLNFAQQISADIDKL